MRADLTEDNPEADGLLDELGHVSHALPFVAVFAGDKATEPRILEGVFTSDLFLKAIDECPSPSAVQLDTPSSRSEPAKSGSPASAAAAPGVTRETVASPASSRAPASVASVAVAKNPLEADHDELRSADARKAALTTAVANSSHLWQPFDLTRFRELRAAGRSVIIDWTAEW